MLYHLLIPLLVLALPHVSHSLCSSDMEGELCKDIGLPEDQATCIAPITRRNNHDWPCIVGRPATTTQPEQRGENELDQLENMLRRALDGAGGAQEEGQGVGSVLLEVGVTGSGDMLQGCTSHFLLAETKTVPYIRYQQAKPGSRYLLLMVDQDACGSATQFCHYVHWIVKDIPGSSLLNPTQLTAANNLIPYKPPSPPSGTHRYQFLLFEVPEGTTISQYPDGDHRANFDLNYYIGVHDLCVQLRAGFQYRATAGE